MTRIFFAIFLAASLFGSAGCIMPKITVFSDHTEPLDEYTLQGKGKEKILVISLTGFIADGPKGILPIGRKPGMVQELVSQLKKAEKDELIKALILKIDSPGGSVTASDLIYHEITRYKQRTGAKVVAVMMTVAASGGYYIALPADLITAHPTTITGSIGVVVLRPNVSGLMGKIGVDVEVNKSGKNKDMGSPFRKATEEEEQIMGQMIDGFAGRFLTLVATRRKLGESAMKQIATGRIFSADEALALGLVDRIGYLDDAIREAAAMAGLQQDVKVVVYRREEYNNDNIYNTSTKQDTPEIKLIDTGLAELLPPLQGGFYYLWLPGRSD
jgi:protease-4